MILHHNVTSTSLGAGVGWMCASESKQEFTGEVEAEHRLDRLVAGLPPDVTAASCVTHGLPWTAVVSAAKVEHAQLVVLATHGDLGPDHASVAEQVIDDACCFVLVLHETGDTTAPRFEVTPDRRQVFVVPTDFSPEARPALALAFDLARRLPIDLYLLHVESARRVSRDPETALSDQHRLLSLVPDDLRDRVTVHLGQGDPGHEIAAAAERAGAACIVMGEHTRLPIRRWLTHNTSRDVLHFAHCPVWYVPAGMVAEVAPQA